MITLIYTQCGLEQLIICQIYGKINHLLFDSQLLENMPYLALIKYL